jgi:hypothetical protein
VIVAVDTLREKAKSYELNALAKNDAGDAFEASLLSAIAVALYEVAAALEEAA